MAPNVSHTYLTDNEILADVHRAALSGDEQFARDKITIAAQNPHHIPWLKRLLRDLSKVIEPAIAKLLQEAIAEWETTANETGVRGGEASTQPEEPPRTRQRGSEAQPRTE